MHVESRLWVNESDVSGETVSRRQDRWLRMNVDRTVFLFDGRQRTWLWMTVADADVHCTIGLIYGINGKLLN